MEEEKMNCPHCNGGHLVPQKPTKNGFIVWDYDCDKCGRAWQKRPDGSYESIGATDKEVITKENWEKWTK